MAIREHSKQILFQIHEDLHNWFKDFCSKRGVSMSSYLAEHIFELKQQEEERELRLQQIKQELTQDD